MDALRCAGPELKLGQLRSLSHQMTIDQSVGYQDDRICGNDADDQAEKTQKYDQSAQNTEAIKFPHYAFGGACAGLDGLDGAEAFIDNEILTQAVLYGQIGRHKNTNQDNRR